MKSPEISPSIEVKSRVVKPSWSSSQIVKTSGFVTIGNGFTTKLNDEPIDTVKQPVTMLVTRTKIGCEKAVEFVIGFILSRELVLLSASFWFSKYETLKSVVFWVPKISKSLEDKTKFCTSPFVSSPSFKSSQSS